MLSELFTPVETPEAPNRGFFKGLFGGGAQSLDREDLCEYHSQLYISATPTHTYMSQYVQHGESKVFYTIKKHLLATYFGCR